MSQELPPKKITANKVSLHAGRIAEAEELFKSYTSNGAASKFLQRKPHQNILETQKFLEEWGETSWDLNNKFSWIISEPETGSVAGIFLLILENDTAEIHFGIAPAFWGRGFATGAGSEITKWLFNQSSIKSISTLCDLENIGCAKVLENIGLHRHHMLKQHIFLPSFQKKRDCWVYEWSRPT